MSIHFETKPSIQSHHELSPSLTQRKKTILIAVAVIFAIGMILSYALAAPWLLTVGLFALCLTPLFPLGKVGYKQIGRIPDPTPKSYVN